MRQIGMVIFAAMAVFSTPGQAETWKFENARVFNGTFFETKTLCVANGVFAACRGQVDRNVDLKGAFVLPPFGEGHHHTIIYGDWREEMALKHGIAYAWIMANAASYGPVAREMYGTKDTFDASLAMATITDPKGHPVQIGFNFHDTLADMEGDWVHTVETKKDLYEKWPAVMQTKPDFIKFFLLNSESFAKLKADEAFPTRYRGLNPDLAPEVAKLAHANGLRAAVHVRTSHDFHLAVEAGVDIIAHTPGFTIGPVEEPEFEDAFLLSDLDHPERFVIDPRDAVKAAANGIKVITTLGDPAAMGGQGPWPDFHQRQVAVTIDIQKKNLKTLKDAGVEILVGSDAGEGNSVQEAISLGKKGVLTPLEIITSLSVLTPKAIFPERRIGCFDPGCEGSLVVLERNPLENLENLKSVRFLFKQGNVLFSRLESETK